MIQEFFHSLAFIYVYGIYIFLGGIVVLSVVMGVIETIENHKEKKKHKLL